MRLKHHRRWGAGPVRVVELEPERDIESQTHQSPCAIDGRARLPLAAGPKFGPLSWTELITPRIYPANPLRNLAGEPPFSATPGQPTATLASRRTPGSYNVGQENSVGETMLEHPRITLAPEVLAGKPVIRDTRLSIEYVIGPMADGWSEADILEN